ncbi:hypothetical protein [Streptomyces sp. RKAG337]|uniref:hypothetical protein n=1 Tax=Streptomyces sp. RKAG337 TaxID=2893404 RepID=UPI00203406AD|nr:hypothetical protein [Streptomyces sp. RKAG337]MCM2430932.1 hypothetical protein [Streptomyces sp. RKAG337]
MNDILPAASEHWHWQAPEPRQLAELRQQMEEFNRTNIGLLSMAGSLQDGRSSLFPYITGAGDPAASAAVLLCGEESQRLADARLYYVDEDTTAAALAASVAPPLEQITPDRLPSPAGLMVFASPIGSYEVNSGGLGEPGSPPIHTPIVAVSWGPWSADRAAVQWVANTVHGREMVRPGERGIWITFYTACGAAYSAMAPDTVVVNAFLGERATAGEMLTSLHRAGRPELTWDNETVLFLGRTFPPAGSPLGTTGQWAQTVYTAWQLMAQTGQHAWTETEVVRRDRPGRKRDQRAGITGDGDVRVVRLRPDLRPPADATAKDRTASDGRMPPRTDFRWEVPPYRSPNRCLNTRLHATGGCTHAERIIRKHVNGPKGKPVRGIRGPVYVWDQVPSNN